MNLKPKCTQCRKELVYFHMMLMMGPQGYRRYAVCEPCAGKGGQRMLRETDKRMGARMEDARVEGGGEGGA